MGNANLNLNSENATIYSVNVVAMTNPIIVPINPDAVIRVMDS